MGSQPSDDAPERAPLAPAPGRPDPANPADCHPGVGFREFIAMMAAMMAVNALSIDAMLPVLPQIGDTLNLTSENDQQWVVTSFLLGFGVAQLIHGPLSDRFGRRPVLFTGLSIYVVFTVAVTFSRSLEMLIVARMLEGAGAAATRVLVISIIRDCYSGRRMARVMSITFIIFLLAPVLAPALGEAIAMLVPWQWIFGVLAVFATGVVLWAAARLPETLNPANRRALSAGNLLEDLKFVASTRLAVGYMLASMVIFGALFGFITSARQVFAEALNAPDLFTTAFAMTASCMAFASYLNSRIVERIGTRRVSHAALVGFIAMSALHALWAMGGGETLWTFVPLQALTMFCFGLVGVNFNAMAMEPLGRIAGTGSSLLGSVTTVGGALGGFYIGQQFDGTAMPLILGFLVCGLIALVIVTITERGRLFHPSPSSSD